MVICTGSKNMHVYCMYLYVYVPYTCRICVVSWTYTRICTDMHVSMRPATFSTKTTCKYVYMYIYAQYMIHIRSIYDTYVQYTDNIPTGSKYTNNIPTGSIYQPAPWHGPTWRPDMLKLTLYALLYGPDPLLRTLAMSWSKPTTSLHCVHLRTSPNCKLR